jgi:hypothetical protein
MYGMGGQLAVYVPDKDIILITTADAQGRKGGVQLIYDSFWDEIVDKLDALENVSNKDGLNKVFDSVSDEELEAYANSRKLEIMEPSMIEANKCAHFLNKINKRSYEALDENVCTIKKFSIDINEDKSEGCFNYTNAYGDFSLRFGFGKNIIQQFANYDLRVAASASVRSESLLDIKIQVIDEVLGNIYFALNFKDPYITVMMRKIEEHTFEEYDGVFSAKLVD